MVRIRRIETEHCLAGEGPVWDVREQALYFVDVVNKKVHRYEPASETTRSWDVPQMIGSLALRETGGAVLAMFDGIYSLDFDSGDVKPFAHVEGQGPHVRFNDGKVDRRGRFIIGSSDSDFNDPQHVGALCRLDVDRSTAVLDEGIALSNGPCWAPDNRTFYFSDSKPFSIYAYDYDIETGAATNRRLFADTREYGGVPDGATVDSDGLIWVVISEGGKIVVYRPDGRIERIVETPTFQIPTSISFGGPNLDQLYVTSIDPKLVNRPHDEGGGTFVIEGLGARGLPEPRYGG
jgi:sugar lactone lactonase YvrE